MNKLNLDLSYVKKLFIATLVADLTSSQQDPRNALIKELYKRIDCAELWQFAKQNRSEPTVAHGLLETIGEEQLPVQWKEAHKKSLDLISSYMLELDRVADLLSTFGLPMVALKNAGIARGIYSCVGCCPMGDLDVLVKPGDFHQAHEILTENGFEMDTRCSLEEAELGHAEQSGGAEYTKLLSNGETLWFELQWRPVAGRWIRPDQEPSAEELMARSIEIPGTTVRLLAPEDNLIQVALHTAKHTYVRAPGFRLHTDVDRIVKFQKIDWEIFIDKVIRFQVKTAVYFSLIIPKELFGTPVPDEVLRELSPASWKNRLISSWLERIGLFNPDERKFGKIGYIIFNCLLYDSLLGLLKGILPSRKWLKEHYKFESNLLLPYYYIKRIANLTFKRVM